MRDGDADGPLTVGLTLGDVLGDALGDADGNALGMSGDAVGDADGDVLGEVVGSADGAAVGVAESGDSTTDAIARPGASAHAAPSKSISFPDEVSVLVVSTAQDTSSIAPMPLLSDPVRSESTTIQYEPG